MFCAYDPLVSCLTYACNLFNCLTVSSLRDATSVLKKELKQNMRTATNISGSIFSSCSHLVIDNWTCHSTFILFFFRRHESSFRNEVNLAWKWNSIQLRWKISKIKHIIIFWIKDFTALINHGRGYVFLCYLFPAIFLALLFLKFFFFCKHCFCF